MEELHLSDTELRYFADLFLLCSDSQNSLRVPTVKACELFRTTKLPNETIRQITDLCTSGSSSDLGRIEFYAALKLIAAAQAGLAITPDIMTSAIEVPLPRFTWTNDDQTSDLIQLSENVAAMRLKTSPSASSTASDSPTPTNSVQDKGWANAAAWEGIVGDEHRQLLGTEEESSDRHSSDDEAETQRGSAEETEDMYSMSEEQREYYTAQFRSLQPAPSKLLAGSIARLFFEKSRLPMNDLRKIWQLSDVTKDGALSLDEFNIAMHLVVLRRNHIPLPDSLPVTLLPPPPPPAPPPREEPPPPSPGQVSTSSEPRGSKQWTTFVDSPTNSVASPGPKPVNFDFHKSAVEQDPKIFHPVPVRVTPETNHPTAEEDQRRMELETVPVENYVPHGKKTLLQSLSTDNADIRPIQRPHPRKPPPGPGAIPPPPHLLPEDSSGPTSLPIGMTPKKEPPPPPPPRPYRGHTRSSSLDLNRLGRSASLQAPPAPPPRASPNSTSPKRLTNQRSEGDVIPMTFAGGFPGGEDEGIAEIDGVPRRHGAFHVYRKHPSQCSPAEAPPSANNNSLRKLEMQNTALARLCMELHQELLIAQADRNLLQTELDKLQARFDP